MSDYIVTTDFSAKDALTTGDSNKLVSGAPLDVEFAAIATAIATKPDETTMVADQTAVTTLSATDTLLLDDGATKKITVANARTQLALGTVAGFHAIPASNQSGIVDQTWTDVAFATETYDKGGDFSTPNFTAPATGEYLFSWFIHLTTALTDGKFLGTRLYHTTDTAPISGSVNLRVGGGTVGATFGTAIAQLTANDQVKVQVFHDLGSDVTLDAADTGANGHGTMFFAGVRLS